MNRSMVLECQSRLSISFERERGRANLRNIFPVKNASAVQFEEPAAKIFASGSEPRRAELS